MKTSVYNKKGEKVKEIELPKNIFGVDFNNNLVFQVYTSFLSNQRQPLAFTKDRSEVSGGGKKPWRQKGTGRARHSSIRSPLWKGGGVTFGPRQNERNFKRKINKKVKDTSLKMVLSQKLKDDEIKIIDELKFENLKTKEANNTLKKIFGDDLGARILILVSPEERESQRIFKNISFIEMKNTSGANIYDLLNNKYLLLSEHSIGLLGKRLK